MRPDVHAAALRSAAKLVLGMASLATVTTACASEAADAKTGASTDAVMTKDDGATNATNTSGLDKTKEPTSKACQATLASAFPQPGDYQYEAVAQPHDVAACCDEELTKHGAMTAYRWDCCVAYDETAPVDPGEDGKVDPWDAPTGMKKHGWACTPWGPPVPPKMKRSRKASPARRDMNLFLAAQVA